MMRFLKLTFAGKNTATIVNMDSVRTMYRITDHTGRYEPSTKIVYKDGEFLNVAEDLQTILKLINNFNAGHEQDTDWEEDVPTVEQKLETSYRRRTYSKERNFNSINQDF